VVAKVDAISTQQNRQRGRVEAMKYFKQDKMKETHMVGVII
jgi:hypothetical protein